MNLEVPLSASSPLRKSLFRIPAFKALVTTVIVVLVAALCAVIPKSVAQEAVREECAAKYTDLKWRNGSPGVSNNVYDQKSGRAEVEFNWSVNDNVQEGDQFKITLPSQLVTVATGSLELKDEKGETAATAVISGGQKEVIFKLTDYVKSNFQVKGSAYFTVEWDRTASGLTTQGFGKHEEPGKLTFNGCGGGDLLGVYTPDGPPGVTHRNSKTGIQYDNPVQINGKTFYLFAWTIFVGSDTGKTDFVVEDTPPTGHQIACSGDFDHGRAPVYLDAVRSANADPDRHYIVDGSGNPVGGTHNMSGVVSETIPYGDGYDINCTSEMLKVRFPYGVDPSTGPRINLITYTEKMPEPGSAVINKAKIKGNETEGTVFIPSAGGWAEGKKGGFAVRKKVNGSDINRGKRFIFEWSCSPSDNLERIAKKGIEEIEDGKDFHISDLDKGLICKVSEKDADIEGFERETTWTVSGNKVEDGKVEFPVREKNEDAVVVEAVNTYTKKTEPKNGSFKIVKTVKGLPETENLPTYLFDYSCKKDDAEVKAGVASIKGAGETQVDGVPVGASCLVTEQENSAKVPGYSVEIPEKQEVLIVEGKTGVVEVTNSYKKDFGKFSVLKKVVANGVNVPEDKAFAVDYTCTKNGSEEIKGALSIKNGVSTESPEIPVGYSCKVAEREYSAQIDDATVDIDNGQPVGVIADKTAQITVTNTYRTAVGGFKIVKTVDGLPAAQEKKNYKFNYTCTKHGKEIASGVKEISGAGEATVEKLAEGASCAVTEDQESAQVKGYSLVVETGAPVLITAGTTGTVTVNNTYSKKVGSFSITKKLVDPDGVATGKKFTFDYKCVNEELGEVKEGVLGPIGAGEEAKAENIPAGSICTVTEKNAEVGKADLKVSGLDSITIVDNKEEKVVATNEYSAWRASLKLNKKILGPQVDALLNKNFDVDYVCTLGTYSKNGTVTISAKKPAEITDVRSGATCKFTEKTDTAKVEGFEFALSASTTATEVVVGDKGSTSESTLVNAYDGLGRISLTKKVSGLGSVLSGSSQNPREFDVEVSWTDEKGVKQTREVKISEGKITNLDPLPVGTELLLKEIMPKNTAFTTWSTPGFSTTNPGVELKDHGDGTATLLVSVQTVKEAALIEVHNTANIPWWWILVPTLPLFIPPLLPSGSSSSSMPVTPATSAPQPAPKNVPAPKDADKKPKKLLAKTGAEIGVVAILGMLAIFAGLILVIRRRNS
ncbi:putative secreted LPxTG protein [Corynebacterium ulcerans 809]|uniref:DUF5979 domain-containing protein n=1 Tax=Corynebacterium ulcerans TaxID=65058 RepID=UPI000218557F|nr:DUF5979 domain-containing protein [Corynebacterium ulcerans]AEG82349.1 putative secreted LPxTG protein [Corynebacterium ulcerans 809]